MKKNRHSACIHLGALLNAVFQKRPLPVFLNVFLNRKTVGIQTTNMPMWSSHMGGKTAWGLIPRNVVKWAIRLKIKPPVAMIESVFISVSFADGTERCLCFQHLCLLTSKTGITWKSLCFSLIYSHFICPIACSECPGEFGVQIFRQKHFQIR